VLLSAWKRAEDGGGTVMRFIELGGKPENVKLSGALLKNSAGELCNAVEECARTIGGTIGGDAEGLRFEVGPRRIFTLRVRPYVTER
jgi:alpha-mannosidase